MKSRISMSSNDIRKIVEAEVKERMDVEYARIAAQVTRQVLAVVCYVLHLFFGFGGKRLKRLLDIFNDVSNGAQQGFCGKPYDGEVIAQQMEKQFDLNLQADEIQVATVKNGKRTYRKYSGVEIE